MNRHAGKIALLALLPGIVLAQGGPGENVTHGYAQVLRATPVYQTYRVRVPETHCDGAGQADGRYPMESAVAVRRVVERNNRVAGTGRCRTVEVERSERRLTGYDVEYQYKGETYMSRLAGDPGNRLRIRVTVSPDEPTLDYR